MNKLFKSATMIALVVFGAISVESCKKGEEDPGLTLRSRDGRLSGTWVMKSTSMTSEESTDIDDPDPDFDGNTVERNSTYSESWDGTAYTRTETSSSKDDDGDSYSSEESLSGGVYSSEDSWTSGGTTVSDESEGTYTASQEAEYTFEKDGTFTMKRKKTLSITMEESNTDFGYTLTTVSSMTEDETVTGTWAWLGGNDADEIENEERVALWYDDHMVTETNEEDYDYTDTDDDDFFDWNEEDETNVNESTRTYNGKSTEPDEIWTLVMLRNTEMKAMVEGNHDSEYTNKTTNTSDGTSVSFTQREVSKGSYMAEIEFEKQ